MPKKEKITWTNRQEYFWSGILIIVATIFLLHLFYTPYEKSQIRSAYELCNYELEVLGQNVQVGMIGQELLDKEAECRSIYYDTLILDYGWWGYLLGAIFIVISFLVKEKKSN